MTRRPATRVHRHASKGTMKAIMIAGGLMLGCSNPSAAQVRASEAAMVQQTVDGTKITIEYFRPAIEA